MSSIFLERRLELLRQAREAIEAWSETIRTALDGLDDAPLEEAERQKQRADLQTQLDRALEIRDAVEADRNLLDRTPDGDKSDDVFLLALLLWLNGLAVSTGAQEIIQGLEADPVFKALEAAPALTQAAAAAVVKLRQVRRLNSNDLAAIYAAAGSDTARDQLIYAGHRRWLAIRPGDRPYLYQDIAVLLPLRLETLFKEGDGQWTMHLRIIPDEASICRDNPTVTRFEIDSLAAMWAAIYQDLPAAARLQPVSSWLDSPRGIVEWSLLCDRFGGGRAAWLASNYPPAVDGAGIGVEAPEADNGKPPDNRVGGFPRTIEIWVDFGNGPGKLADTPIATEALTFDVVGQRVPDDGSAVIHEKDRWWVSWEAAKQVGLGLEIPLPAGHTPSSIKALYAVGLGDENPAEHFRAQIDAGEMAILPPGAPTNAVDGQQAADLVASHESWRDVAKRRLQSHSTGLDLGMFLAGMHTRLPAVPEPTRFADMDQILVGALWPALWGHYARDLWGWGDAADQTGLWAWSHLRPGGPLPAIRIDTQPYGLLPTTSLARWKADPVDGLWGQIAAALQPSLLAMRAHWADTARERGNVFGADTQKVLDLISRDALSAGYGYRVLFPLPLWQTIYGSTTGYDPGELQAKVKEMFARAYDTMQRGPNAFPEFRHHLGGGHYLDLNIPLVVPNRWPNWFYKEQNGTLVLDDEGRPIPVMTVAQGFVRVLTAIRKQGHRPSLLFEELQKTLPNSLLIRLLIYAATLSAAGVVQKSQNIASLLEPIVSGAERTRLHELADGYDPDLPHDDPAGEIRRILTKSLDLLIDCFGSVPEDSLLANLERTFRAALDTAAHRIDPWITGIAYQRLRQMAPRQEARFRLGVYGWIEGPIRGEPGPTEGGLLHAPSHSQALAGVILRDKFINEGKETRGLPGDRNVWSMQLESRDIRMAVELASEARLGSHIFEVVGRQVERIIGSKGGVEQLRMAYPLQPGHPDPKRVCQGIEALKALLGATSPIAVKSEQFEKLEALRRAVDTYGDLLVAEAVHHVVTGRSEIAGSAMDAAAGLSQPPTLEFTQTPLSGYSVNTSVITVLPFREPVNDADPVHSPARIADGSVPAALEAMLGTPDQWIWLWEEEGAQRTVSLQDFGLEPIDTVVFSADLLEDMVRFKLDIGQDQILQGSGPQQRRLAKEVVAALGNEAVLLRDFAAMDEPETEIAATRQQDAAILKELTDRYLVLRESAQRLIDDLGAGIADGDGASLRRDLFRALRWGIRPMVDRAEQQALFGAFFNKEDPADAHLLPRLAERAQKALQGRLAAAPPPGDPKNKQPVSRSIAELAAPEGQLAILTRIGADMVAAKSRLVIANPDEALDTDWLPTVAAVRPAIARLEALQLESELNQGFAGFTSWSSAPDDHWQTAAVARLEQRRQSGEGPAARVLPRFVAAYGFGSVLGLDGAGENPMLAVGLLDSWGEVVPRARHTSTAAFGFNAPIARPPQAVLLAVPPALEGDSGTAFDTAALVEILQETRELAHARAVRFEDLGTYLAAVPAMMFQANAPTGVRLDPSTRFEGI